MEFLLSISQYGAAAVPARGFVRRPPRFCLRTMPGPERWTCFASSPANT